MAATRPNDDALKRAIGQINECKKSRSAFINGVEKRYKAYRGFVEEIAGDWRSQAHPPYIQHIVETTLAGLVVDKFRFRVRPRLTLDTYLHPDMADQARVGAEAHQILMDWQVRKDKLSGIQRAFNLQHAIAGLTVAKTYWVTREERRRRLVAQDMPLLDSNGEPLTSPVTGENIVYPSLQSVEGTTVVYDGPTTEVRDVRDFMWPEQAVSIDKAGYVIDRVWFRKDELAKAFSEGQFGTNVGGWSWKDVIEVLGDNDRANGVTEEFVSREQSLYKINRTKDLFEVCEVWDQTNGKMTTVINRCALGAHVDFPFWHNRPPFTVCSTQPDLFRIPGISQVEKIDHLQKLLWELMNQRIDNLKLINNAIFFFRPDIEDPDEYEFEPGARWPVEDPAQVNMWQPNVIPSEVSLQGESLLKGDMQNLAGGFPFSSGTDSQNVDQKTATGAALITNIAQRSIDIAKQQVDEAMQDIGEQRMILNQQFIREPTIAPAIGTDDVNEIHVILPEILQGDYDFELEPSSDPLMEQQEQASANGLAQILASLMGPILPLAQQGMAKMINFDAIVEDILRAYGKDDVARYFISTPPPAMSAPGQAGQQQSDQTDDGQPNLGVTAPQATDAATSPSNALSVAPTTLLQRALALSKGGARNTQ